MAVHRWSVTVSCTGYLQINLLVLLQIPQNIKSLPNYQSSQFLGTPLPNRHRMLPNRHLMLPNRYRMLPNRYRMLPYQKHQGRITYLALELQPDTDGCSLLMEQ
uniref:Putative secreted protein n=1 Tax=Anopheles triannulatus TaxID=58253 RepID=A0A2M4B3G9_9DIPT